MKWKCAGVLLLFFFAQLVGIAPPAQAASIYDETIRTVDTVRADCFDVNTGSLTGEKFDLSDLWQPMIMGDVQSYANRIVYAYSLDGSSHLSEVRSALSQRIADGKGWSVSQMLIDSETRAHQVQVFISSSPSSTMSFTSGTSPTTLLTSPLGYQVIIYCRSDAFILIVGSASASAPIAFSEPVGGSVLYPWFSNLDIDYPSGYEGEVVPTTPPPAKYVALGDSFSSGEGNPPFEYGTEQGGTNENRCHRSPKAYPRLLQNDPNLDLGPTAFVACSGATTDSIRFGHPGTGNWDEGAQVDALSSATELVTLTVGGNDVDFVGYATSCGLSLCGVGTTAYNDMMGRINDPSFKTELVNTYVDILGNAENATMYVLDYPYLVDPTGTDGTACEPLVDLSAAVPVQIALNGVIEDAVDEVRNLDPDYYGRLIYMPANHFGSPFIDHHLCTDDPGGSYFNGLNLLSSVYSFHPNANGQQAYYQIMEDYLS